MALSDQIIGVESGGDADATNPNSSASGAGQFIDSTWLSVLKQHFPDIAAGKSDSDLLALKSDPGLNRQMVDAYASDNGATLAKNGLPVTPGTTYLAHFAGPQGAVSVLSADPSTLVGSILGPSVVKANPFLSGMTAGDLRNWADRKMGGAGSVLPSHPTGGLLATQPSGGVGLLNSGSQQTMPTQDPQSIQAALNSMAQPQALASALPQIRYAQPRAFDRARFLAALTQRGIV